MLFNSYEFIFAFLPVTAALFFLSARSSRDLAIVWLIVASIFFYAWWRPLNLLLIAPSIALNYWLARGLLESGETRPGRARLLLVAGLAFNLCFLGYFKYLAFLQGAANDVFGTDFVITHLVLPLGISFITFQKIAFLVDVHAGRVRSFTFREYALFVLFFPQLIAGPIVHYREMVPQFQATDCRYNRVDVTVGLTLFAFGLFKKLMLADPIAALVAPIYAAADAGNEIALFEAWMAAIGFTLQIYFDFSGYTDMALGLARIFGIKLPPNFDSPLRASSIIDFWLRWHISLTRFLTAYVYNPMVLAMTRRRLASGRPAYGPRNATLGAFLVMLALPTLITMVISGVWHGAGYQFIAWGALHGVLLAINHGWRQVRPRFWPDARSYARVISPVGWALTFLSVVVAMVLFRSSTLTTAFHILAGMGGGHGVTLPYALHERLSATTGVLDAIGIVPVIASGRAFVMTTIWIVALLFIALAMPNTSELLARFEPALGFKRALAGRWLAIEWRPSPAWAIAASVVFAAGLLSLGELSAFLYWQF